MFRHEKTFFNPTMIAGLVTTAMADAEVDALLDQFMKPAVSSGWASAAARDDCRHDKDGDAGEIRGPGEKGHGPAPTPADSVRSDKPEVRQGGGRSGQGTQAPDLASATPDNADAMGALAKEMDLPLVAKRRRATMTWPP